MSLYAWVIIGTIAGPFALSFDKKVAFYKTWKALFPALLLVGTTFLMWDEFFTVNDVWGFTSAYNSGIYIAHLPLEECLFFLVVPYSCVFIHACLKAYFPTFNPVVVGRYFAFTLALSGFYFGAMNSERWYTATACFGAAILITGTYFVAKVEWFNRFALTFLIALIPFLIVNGILTGSITPEPVVWYNEDHIIGWRISTIPFEDIYYNLCMLLPIVWLYEWGLKRFKIVV